MAQVTCPQCRGTFQLDLSNPAAQLTCPHCGGAVESPTAPPTALAAAPAEPAVTLAPYVSPEPPPAEYPPVHEPPIAQDPPTLQAAVIDEPLAPPAPEAEIEQVSADLATEVAMPPHTPITVADEPPADERTLRHYASEEKASRRFVKNFIVWVLCAIVMIVLLMLFLTD